mmetsp:Transcript_16147/g.40510  ORF Transcript_16147/g.40510 Transcript_16147/m.40510 type:complete len:548 (+) Transcript_16147:410-2053(+)
MAARTGNMAVAAFPVSERHCLGTPSRRPAARNTRVQRGAVCSISTSREKGATTFLHGVAVPLRVPLVGPLQPAPLEAIYDYDYDGEGFSPGGLSLDRDGSTLGLEVAEEAAVGLKARFAEALEGVPTWPRTLLLCCASNVVCATARGAMSVSVFPMTQLYGWSDSFTGTVSSAFFIGFTLSSLCGAYASTKLKPEHMLTAAVAGTAMFTALTPLAAQLDPETGALLIAARVATGASEGLIYPALQGLVTKHVPKENRAQGLGLCYSGAEMGNVAALTTSPFLIDNFGWASNFHAFSMLGLGWLAAWTAYFGRDASSVAAAPTAPSRVDKKVEAAQDAAPVPWREILSSPAYRAAVASHCSYQFGNLVALSWLPTYFHQQFHADMGSSAALSVMPWISAIAATNLSGWTADQLVSRGVLNTTTTRKLMQTLASAGPAACITHLLLSSGHDMSCMEAMLTLSAMISLLQFKAGGYGPNFMDLSPKHASLMCGLSTSAAGVFGTAGIMYTGAVLEHLHSWPVVFGSMAVVQLTSLGLFLKDGSAEEQFQQ